MRSSSPVLQDSGNRFGLTGCAASPSGEAVPIGPVGLFWMGRYALRTGLCTRCAMAGHRRGRLHRRRGAGRAEVANPAIAVCHALYRSLAWLMHMCVVSEVAYRRCAFMQAIRRRPGPGTLAQGQHDQQHQKNAAHGVIVTGTTFTGQVLPTPGARGRAHR